MELGDDQIINLTIAGLAMMLLLGFFFIAFFATYRKRQIEFKVQQENQKKAFSEELLRSQLEISEQVMRHISEEIHDNIGQSIIVAKMQLSLLKHPEFQPQLIAADDLLDRALRDMRSLSKTLNGQYISRQGINETLKNEINLINTSRKIKCELHGSFPPKLFDSNTEIIIFRCVQEAISNAIKYAKAEILRISISSPGQVLKIEISDDGCGLPANWKERKGLGLDNLDRRVRLIGGELKISSQKNVGTNISITLPLTNNQTFEPS